ncbi:hypothetical protein [Bacillus sp. B-jedd]|uniref:hypothetical protein n=1 Tax=Bacillus sp. B-jedd TaxID=1476857 RepID=UPI00051562BC|nr:hypothetical protein [Bacillus sp. B-jedd]CEG28827.1 sporulation protein YhcO/YhcP [Bacillus sp. B-jedd]
MIKRIAFWGAVVAFVFGLNFALNAGVNKALTMVKPVSYFKVLVDEEKGDKKIVGNITFKYAEGSKNPHINVAIDAAINSIKTNKKLFEELFGNEFLDEPVSIVLVEDPAKLNELFGPTLDGHIDGSYVFEKRSIYIGIPDDDRKINQYKQTIVHEYTHHLIHMSLVKSGQHFSDLPVWFHEGIASYVEKKRTGTLSDEIENMEKVSFKELETHEQWASHLKVPYHPYLQSSVMAGLLVKNKVPGVVNQIIEGSKKNSFNESVSKITGMSVASYESETFKTLKEFPSMIIKARGELNFDHNPEKALQSALQLNDLVPNVNEVLKLIADIYAAEGDYENSIAYLERTVHLFPLSGNFLLVASYYLFTDLDKALEASKMAVKVANSEDKPFYDKKLNDFNELYKSVQNGNPFNGYLSFLHTDPYFTDKAKVDLINSILEKYPEATKGKEALLTLKQNLQ